MCPFGEGDRGQASFYSSAGENFARGGAIHNLASPSCAGPLRSVMNTQASKAVVGIHALLTRSLFGGGIPRRLLGRVSLGKPTSAPLRF
jgi:hypothetical protein